MPAVLLVRHAQASFGAEDYDVLSDLGREQSAVIGQALALRGLRDPVAATGSLRRQRDTAALALPAAGLEVETTIDDRWDEYDSLGLFKRYVHPDQVEHDGSSRGMQVLLDRALAAWVDDGDAGGWTAFSSRVGAALADLIGSLPRGRDAVVFTSGGVIAAVCAGLLGLGADGVVTLNRVSANGGITKLTVGAAGTSLVSFNDHAHFDGASRSLLTYR